MSEAAVMGMANREVAIASDTTKSIKRLYLIVDRQLRLALVCMGELNFPHAVEVVVDELTETVRVRRAKEGTEGSFPVTWRGKILDSEPLCARIRKALEPLEDYQLYIPGTRDAEGTLHFTYRRRQVIMKRPVA